MVESAGTPNVAQTAKNIACALAWNTPAAALASASLLAAYLLAAGPGAVAAFDGFGTSQADSTYGQDIRFTTTLNGGAPESLELLIETPGGDGSLVDHRGPGGVDQERRGPHPGDDVAADQLPGRVGQGNADGDGVADRDEIAQGGEVRDVVLAGVP